MKTKILLSLFIISSFATASEQDSKDCLQSYKDSLKKKNDKHSAATKRYYNNRMSLAMNGVVLNNYSAPTPPDKFEADIIKATEVDLDYLKKFNYKKPIVLEGIYNSAYEKYSDVTYEKVQSLIKKGFDEDRFCTFFGKKRVPGIQRYVLKELKKESKDSAQVRNPAVINFKEDADSKTYDNKSENEEINKPLEKKGILE